MHSFNKYYAAAVCFRAIGVLAFIAAPPILSAGRMRSQPLAIASDFRHTSVHLCVHRTFLILLLVPAWPISTSRICGHDCSDCDAAYDVVHK
eukprot:2370439-Pleurochrysis_carterae.AAC.4